MPLYEIGLELTILTTFWLCLGVWQKDRSSPGRTSFVALGFAAVTWCTGELAFQREAFSEVVSDRIRYAGVLTLPPLWVGLAGHATRLDLARRVPWFAVVLLAPPVCLYAFLWGGPWSELFLATVPGGEDRYGPLWWIATYYGYTLVLAGSGLFVVSAVRRRHAGHWWRSLAVGAAALVPLVGNAVYIKSAHMDADPTPLLFGFGLLALRSAIFTGGLLDALPVSQHDLIEHLPIGVILTDRRGVVIDLNPAAERRLGLAEEQAVGRNLDAILAESEHEVQAEIASIFSRDHEAGQLVVLDPPAKRRI